MLRSENEESRDANKTSLLFMIVSTLLGPQYYKQPPQLCDKEMQMTYDEVITIVRENANYKYIAIFKRADFNLPRATSG
jgi:hypothetical protein